MEKVKSRGFGDTVEKFTTYTGIRSMVKNTFGPNCGCDTRKEWLNKKFPYKK